MKELSAKQKSPNMKKLPACQREIFYDEEESFFFSVGCFKKKALHTINSKFSNNSKVLGQ